MHRRQWYGESKRKRRPTKTGEKRERQRKLGKAYRSSTTGRESVGEGTEKARERESKKIKKIKKLTEMAERKAKESSEKSGLLKYESK